MTDGLHHETNANSPNGLKGAEKELKHLREDANQAADSIGKVSTDFDAVARLVEKIKVARQRVSILREARVKLG